MTKNKKIPFELILIIASLLLHGYVAFSPTTSVLNWYRTDDAFYYFVTARNIAEGKGITFDEISTTNGFHPLWMIVCIPVFALAKINLILPLRILVIVLVLLNAGTGILLYRFIRKVLSKETAIFAASLWVFLPNIHGLTTQLGIESGINAFFLIAFLSFLVSFKKPSDFTLQRLLTISCLGVLSIFSRLDNVFFVFIVGIWLIFRLSVLRWQILLDLIFGLLSGVLAYFLRVQDTGNIFNFLPFAYLFISVSLVSKIAVLFLLRGYGFSTNQPILKMILRTLLGVGISSLLTSAVIFLVHDVLHLFMGFPRAVLLIDLGIAAFLFLLWRSIENLLMRLKKEKNTTENLVFRWKAWIKKAFIYYGPLTLALIAYFVFNYYYAGTAMPVSGQIKRWWGTLPLTVYGSPIQTIPEFFRSWFDPTMQNGPWWLVTIPVDIFTEAITRIAGFPIGSLSHDGFKRDISVVVWVILGLLIFWIIRKHRNHLKNVPDKFALLPLFAGCTFHVISYKATGYLHAKYWYWISEMLCTLIILTLPIECIFENIRQYKHGMKATYILSVSLSLILFINLASKIIPSYPYNRRDDDIHAYIKETEFIEKNTDENSIIGMTGGGATAYFIKNRTIVNLDGLINGIEYCSLLMDAHADRYLDKIGVQYIYGAEAMLLESDPYGWIFPNHLSFMKMEDGATLYTYHSLFYPQK